MWQASLKHRLRESARERLAERGEDAKSPAPPPLGDFGLNHDEGYVEDTVEMLKLSNFQCWPELGGWAVQDDLLVKDVKTWLALERRTEWEALTGFTEEDDEDTNSTYIITMDQMG